MAPLPRLALVLVLLGAWSLPAQSPSTKLLTFDIAAIDGHGTLVSDLQASDFRVTDAGRRQEIAYFRRGRDVTPPPRVLSQEQTNHAYATFPHVLVVLLDQLNAKVELKGTEWQEIARGLGRAEGEHDLYFYVLTKNGSMFPVHGLPDSWVEAAAGRFRVSEILPLFEDMRKQYRERPDDLDVSRSKVGDPQFDLVMKRKQLYTATALQQLATRLAPVPGTKSIVWIGPQGSKPVSDDPTRNIREEWGESIDPVPVYYVAAADSATFRFDPYRPGLLERDVEKTMARALADSQRGYRIGYYPPADNWDGRRHGLRMTCTRPRVTVRARAGYTAVRPVDVEDDRRQGIPDLPTASPFDTSTIRFRAVPVSGSPAPRFDLRVNAEDVLFQGAGDALTCSLAVQAIHYREGEEPDVLQDPLLVNLKFTAADRQTALRDGIPIHLAVAAADAAARYRIVILDRATHSFGTLTIPAGSKHQ